MRRIVLAAVVFLWAVMPFSASAQGPIGMGMMYDEESMGAGMMMGRGAGCGMEASLNRLNLTDEQEAKVDKIFDDLRREHWPILGKIMDERTKLRELYNEDVLDAKKIAAISDTLHGLHKQIMTSKIEALNKVRALLTKDQLAQLKRQGGWRGGCGMAGARGGRGGGMMREMMMDRQ